MHLFQTPPVDAQGGSDDCADASPIHAMPNTSAIKLAIKAPRIDIVAPNIPRYSVPMSRKSRKDQVRAGLSTSLQWGTVVALIHKNMALNHKT